MEQKRKLCPLMFQSEVYQDVENGGIVRSKTYFRECCGEECAAYTSDGQCNGFNTSVLRKESENRSE